MELKIPKEHHKFIIGRDKAQQKKIELATATKIVIPRPSEQSEEIRIVGTREGVEKARHQIQMISDKQVGGEGAESVCQAVAAAEAS